MCIYIYIHTSPQQTKETALVMYFWIKRLGFYMQGIHPSLVRERVTKDVLSKVVSPKDSGA